MSDWAREANVRTLMRTAKQVRMCMENALAGAGSSYATFIILDAVSLDPGLSQRQIAQRISIEGPPLTRHLDRMETDGLVERRRDDLDRRIQRVYPTAAGTALYTALCPVVARLEHRYFDDMPARDVAGFRTVIGQLKAKLDADVAGAKARDED